MKITEEKEQIFWLEAYMELIEGYVPETVEWHAIKLYVAKVAAILNESGFRIGKRKIVGKDMQRAKPMVELHELAVKLFKQNRKIVKEQGKWR